MKQLIDYFDQTYIINLVDRPDRRQQVIRDFRRIGINIPSDKVKFYAATRPGDKGAFHSVGARGVFTSHREVFRLAQRANHTNLLVLEDDIRFRKLDASIEQRLIDDLGDKEWDMIRFGYIIDPSQMNRYRTMIRRPGLLAWPEITLGTHFYAINGSFIPEIIDYMDACELQPPGHPDSGPTSADGALNRIRLIRSVRFFISVPNLGYQRSSRSDITPHPFFDRLTWLSPLVSLGRNLKNCVAILVDR